MRTAVCSDSPSSPRLPTRTAAGGLGTGAAALDEVQAHADVGVHRGLGRGEGRSSREGRGGEGSHGTGKTADDWDGGLIDAFQTSPEGVGTEPTHPFSSAKKKKRPHP